MTIVDCAVYQDGKRRDGELELQQAYEQCAKDGSSWVWIGLHQPTEEEFDRVKDEFDLHPLAVEDAIKAHQRPKLEEYGDSLFFVFKPARYHDDVEEVEFGEILVFMGQGFLITVRHGQTTELSEVRKHVESSPEVMARGPAGVLHAIVDQIVDDYDPVLRGVEDDIEEVEETVFSPDRTNPAQRIYHLKQEVLDLHRATAPLVGPLEQLSRDQHKFIPEEMHSYFRDVYDHAVRANDMVETFREMLNSVLGANLTQVTVRQNDDVRKISAWVAILAVPTMIAGIYGMNFEHMPELRWTLGYPAVLGVMVVACSGLYAYFKRAGWL
jgi:magnesium transporter